MRQYDILLTNEIWASVLSPIQITYNEKKLSLIRYPENANSELMNWIARMQLFSGYKPMDLSRIEACTEILTRSESVKALVNIS